MNKQFFILFIYFMCTTQVFVNIYVYIMLIIFNYNSRVFTYICPPNFLLKMSF